MGCLEIAFYFTLSLLVLKIYLKLVTGWCRAKACLVGKTALVTGGNSGIGYETALDLASRGCRVIIADIADSEASKRRISEETGNDNIIWKYLDLGSLKSTREFAEDIVKTESRLDILINNAGATGFGKSYSDDGILKDMHICYLGPFLLTHLLVDLLKKTPKSRVVFVSSVLAFVHQLKSAEDINRPFWAQRKSLQSWVHYSNSKLCNIIAARGFAKRLSKHDITVNAVNPGHVHTTIFKTSLRNLGELTWLSKISYFLNDNLLFVFQKTAEEGAQTTLHCAIDKSVEGVSGQFFADCKIQIMPPKAADERFAEAVWTESEKLVKLSNEEKIH